MKIRWQRKIVTVAPDVIAGITGRNGKLRGEKEKWLANPKTIKQQRVQQQYQIGKDERRRKKKFTTFLSEWLWIWWRRQSSSASLLFSIFLCIFFSKRKRESFHCWYLLFPLAMNITDGYFTFESLPFEKRQRKSFKMFAVMPYDTEDRSAAYRRRVAPRADFVCKYCQRRFTKVSFHPSYLCRMKIDNEMNRKMIQRDCLFRRPTI